MGRAEPLASPAVALLAIGMEGRWEKESWAEIAKPRAETRAGKGDGFA